MGCCVRAFLGCLNLICMFVRLYVCVQVCVCKHVFLFLLFFSCCHHHFVTFDAEILAKMFEFCVCFVIVCTFRSQFEYIKCIYVFVFTIWIIWSCCLKLKSENYFATQKQPCTFQSFQSNETFKETFFWFCFFSKQLYITTNYYHTHAHL